ncbi:MAG: DHH family phosphoesterase [Candidatus Heimdallarchaeaceae archaeon]
MQEEFLEIVKFLKSAKCKKIGIFSHQNADPDAISSSIALKELFLELVDKNLEVKLIASSLNSLAENLIQKTNEKIIENVDKYDFDAIFLCDTNNLLQLGDIKIPEDIIKSKPIFIIDHHSKNDFAGKAKATIIKQQTSSTAEIITEIYYELKLKPSTTVATLLLAGIIFDSRRFLYLSDFTFKAVQFLIDCGGNYEKALQTLYTEQTFSEKVARLKGAQRILLHKMDDDLLVISHSNSFESSVARALIELGASCSANIA